MNFTDEQITRYSRHILLPEVGGKGQKKIAQARVLIVGAGGLGSPAALYLAAAGVGTIGLIDSDVVDLSNLQRQVIHHTADVGRPKVQSAQEKITALNPDVKVITYQDRLVAQNALAILAFGDLKQSDVKAVEFSSYGAMWKGMVNNDVDAAFATTITGPAKELETSPRGIVWPPLARQTCPVQ